MGPISRPWARSIPRLSRDPTGISRLSKIPSCPSSPLRSIAVSRTTTLPFQEQAPHQGAEHALDHRAELLDLDQREAAHLPLFFPADQRELVATLDPRPVAQLLGRTICPGRPRSRAIRPCSRRTPASRSTVRPSPLRMTDLLFPVGSSITKISDISEYADNGARGSMFVKRDFALRLPRAIAGLVAIDRGQDGRGEGGRLNPWETRSGGTTMSDPCLHGRRRILNSIRRGSSPSPVREPRDESRAGHVPRRSVHPRPRPRRARRLYILSGEGEVVAGRLRRSVTEGISSSSEEGAPGVKAKTDMIVLHVVSPSPTQADHGDMGERIARGSSSSPPDRMGRAGRPTPRSPTWRGCGAGRRRCLSARPYGRRAAGAARPRGSAARIARRREEDHVLRLPFQDVVPSVPTAITFRRGRAPPPGWRTSFRNSPLRAQHQHRHPLVDQRDGPCFISPAGTLPRGCRRFLSFSAPSRAMG